MAGDDTKYRLWSVEAENYLVLTVPENGNDPTITCKNSSGNQDAEKSSKLQHCMLINSFLSLVV